MRISGVLLRVLGFYLLSGVFTQVLMKFLTGYNITNYNTLKLIPNGPQSLLLAQGGGMFLGFIILPLIYVYFMKPSLKDIFKGMNGKKTASVFVFSILAILFCGPFISALQGWNQAMPLPSGLEKVLKTMEETAKVVTELLVYQPTWSGFLLAAIVIGIIPAIAEELVFRGIMQKELKEENWNPHVIIWVTAIVFSAIHLQFYGFFPRLLLGAMMGYMAWWTNSLSAPMIFHCINNLSTLIAFNLYKYKNLGPDPEQTSFSWYTVLASALITAALIYFFKTFIRKPEEPPTVY